MRAGAMSCAGVPGTPPTRIYFRQEKSGANDVPITLGH
jgi:hypothetical protein